MPMLRTIDRPTNDTRRPSATAASMICCTRSTFEAKQATINATIGAADQPVQRRADFALRRANPGISEFVESHRNRSTPASPSRDIPGRSVGRPSAATGRA